ncbi:hypothetical protein TNCV_3776171 [Trichonephila clavipes]|nr:hypothetical protein TNCV_3776171 [Trichonephila clavipes]
MWNNTRNTHFFDQSTDQNEQRKYRFGQDYIRLRNLFHQKEGGSSKIKKPEVDLDIDRVFACGASIRCGEILMRRCYAHASRRSTSSYPSAGEGPSLHPLCILKNPSHARRMTQGSKKERPQTIPLRKGRDGFSLLLKP